LLLKVVQSVEDRKPLVEMLAWVMDRVPAAPPTRAPSVPL